MPDEESNITDIRDYLARNTSAHEPVNPDFARQLAKWAALSQPAEPTLLPVPDRTYGFSLRIELKNTEPLVWRTLGVPSDIELPHLHDVLQMAMGWMNSHLHRFSIDAGETRASFLTDFDVEEGEEGLSEAGVRLDQVLSNVGDELMYEYDFGDGWEHRVVLEAIHEAVPETSICTGGALACPPEDCGGIGGYMDFAAWVRSGHRKPLLPDFFESADEALDFLPLEWHPDVFDLAEANEAIATIGQDPMLYFNE